VVSVTSGRLMTNSQPKRAIAGRRRRFWSLRRRRVALAGGQWFFAYRMERRQFAINAITPMPSRIAAVGSGTTANEMR
jgi:hypothetical protein